MTNYTFSPDVLALNPQLMKPAKRSKYGNTPTTVDGIRFASKKEAQAYQRLKLMEQAGQIETLTLQPRFVLQDAYVTPNGEKLRVVVYVADFMWVDRRTGRTHVLDAKGMKTQVYRIKEKLFRAKYPQYIFEEK